jgi:hypothetical protein
MAIPPAMASITSVEGSGTAVTVTNELFDWGITRKPMAETLLRSATRRLEAGGGGVDLIKVQVAGVLDVDAVEASPVEDLASRSG